MGSTHHAIEKNILQWPVHSQQSSFMFHRFFDLRRIHRNGQHTVNAASKTAKMMNLLDERNFSSQGGSDELFLSADGHVESNMVERGHVRDQLTDVSSEFGNIG